MKHIFSPKELARIIDASEASIKRWCDKGILAFEKTPGGHRKIPLTAVLTFIKENQVPVRNPELLGLPYSPGVSGLTVDDAQYCFETALEEGNEQLARYVAFDLYLNGTRLATICDEVIAASFHNLGDKWQHDKLEIYQERRGVQLTQRILNALRDVLPQPAENAPLAVGATLKGDPYTLPGMMVECCLVELGWRAVFFGSEHPAPTLSTAISSERPRLFWLSVSHLESTDLFLEAYNQIHHAATRHNVLLAVGGRSLSPELRKKMDYTIFCDTTRDIISFARALDH